MPRASGDALPSRFFSEVVAQDRPQGNLDNYTSLGCKCNRSLAEGYALAVRLIGKLYESVPSESWLSRRY